MKNTRMGRPPLPIGIGQRFSRLTVIGVIPTYKHPLVRCRCDCGNESTPTASALYAGRVVSCGCHKDAATRRRMTTHGLTESAEYRAWCHAKERCTNPRVRNYHAYGGRGIRMCDEWLRSFEAFFTHIGHRPTAKHSLDRINNDGHYEPGNVRWALKRTQSTNTRQTRLITFNGVTRPVTAWADALGIKRSTLLQRLNAYKWPIEKALHPLGRPASDIGN